MKTWTISIASLASFILLAPLAFGQQRPEGSSLFSSDLVMWSYMQEPQQPEPGQTRQAPTPDPSPETQPPASPPASQPHQTSPASRSQGSSAARGTETAAAQSFTGTVSKEADSFILQVSQSVSYKLDNQQQIQQYEGQRVRVTGTLDSSINLIHVEKVEPLT